MELTHLNYVPKFNQIMQPTGYIFMNHKYINYLTSTYFDLLIHVQRCVIKHTERICDS
jgi:hypothetical protein